MILNQQNKMELSLFSGIEPNNLSCILRCVGSYQRAYKKGEFIFLSDQAIKCIGVVIKGQVHMIKEDISGNKTILAIIKKGQIFGETFACGNTFVSTVSFASASDSEIMFLPFNKVIRTCTSSCEFHHKLIENMIFLMAKKNVQLMERVEITSQKSLREKIMTFLNIQAEKQQARHIVVDMSRQDWADYLCVNRSALSRELANMKSEGIIDFDKDTFKIAKK